MQLKSNLKISTEHAWYALQVRQVVQALNTDIRHGLSEEVVVQHREVVGSNELPQEKTVRWYQMFWRQFTNPLVYLLVLAAGVTAWLGEWVDTWVIVLVVLVNTCIGFIQEYQSNKTLEQLKSIVRIRALVVRDGGVKDVDSSELVPGDVVLLKTGQKVPADVRIVDAQDLTTGEALLTGESVPVRKNIDVIANSTGIADRTNMAWMGSVVESGRGRAIVVGTGASTELGKIAHLTQVADNLDTPLQQRLRVLSQIISAVVVVAAIFIFIIGAQGYLSFIEAFKTAVAVAVAAIPEGLLAALSVVLAVSTKRILAQQGLVRRPVAAETLGSTTVIVADKTGTLTEGEMKVEHSQFKGVSKQALLALGLANEAELVTTPDGVTVHGEATDRAKLEYALSQGVTVSELVSDYTTIAELPFDQHMKVVAKFVQPKLRPAETHVYVTGAPEMVLKMCTTIGEYEPLQQSDRASVQDWVNEMAKQGYRLIAVADRLVVDSFKPQDSASLKSTLYDLNYRGVVALRDPIRADVKQTLLETRLAGVRVIMATGDHEFTARSIGAELGFDTNSGAMLDGQVVENMDDATLLEAVKTLSICYRVNPEHKLRIVQALIKNGEAVAMTGDGVNDAPALKAADIGVAVAGATDVTKESADLVLLKNGLATIVDAIREGRIAFDNIRKVTTFLLSGTFTAFLFVMMSFILGTPLPLTAVMILWANLVENGLPTFGLAFERGENDVMQRQPEPRNAPILNREAKLIIFVVSLMRDALLLGVFLWFYNYSDYSIEHIQTLVFAIISIDSLFYIYSIKSFHQPIWREKFLDNYFLLAAVVVGLWLAFMAIYTPLLNYALGTVPLPAHHIGLVFSIAAFEIVLYELVKIWYRWSNKEISL